MLQALYSAAAPPAGTKRTGAGGAVAADGVGIACAMVMMMAAVEVVVVVAEATDWNCWSMTLLSS